MNLLECLSVFHGHIYPIRLHLYHIQIQLRKNYLGVGFQQGQLHRFLFQKMKNLHIGIYILIPLVLLRHNLAATYGLTILCAFYVVFTLITQIRTIFIISSFSFLTWQLSSLLWRLASFTLQITITILIFGFFLLIYFLFVFYFILFFYELFIIAHFIISAMVSLMIPLMMLIWLSWLLFIFWQFSVIRFCYHSCQCFTVFEVVRIYFQPMLLYFHDDQPHWFQFYHFFFWQASIIFIIFTKQLNSLMSFSFCLVFILIFCVFGLIITFSYQIKHPIPIFDLHSIPLSSYPFAQMIQ